MDYLKINEEEGVTTVELRREKALNALNPPLLKELNQAFIDLGKTSHVIILTSSSPKAFSAGADIEAMAAMTQEEIRNFILLGNQLMQTISECPCPVIAAVHGFALGGGLELALSCDFIIASTTSKLGLPEVTIGVIPGFGGTRRLKEAVGERKAKQLIYTGQILSGEEAFAMGLCNEVIPPKNLNERALQIAKTITKYPKNCTQAVKRCISIGCEQEEFVRCIQTAESKKLFAKFIEKKAK